MADSATQALQKLLHLRANDTDTVNLPNNGDTAIIPTNGVDVVNGKGKSFFITTSDTVDLYLVGTNKDDTDFHTLQKLESDGPVKWTTAAGQADKVWIFTEAPCRKIAVMAQNQAAIPVDVIVKEADGR